MNELIIACRYSKLKWVKSTTSVVTEEIDLIFPKQSIPTIDLTDFELVSIYCSNKNIDKFLNHNFDVINKYRKAFSLENLNAISKFLLDYTGSLAPDALAEWLYERPLDFLSAAAKGKQFRCVSCIFNIDEFLDSYYHGNKDFLGVANDYIKKRGGTFTKYGYIGWVDPTENDFC